jgi:hypothetical protein
MLILILIIHVIMQDIVCRQLKFKSRMRNVRPVGETYLRPR